MHFDHVHLLLIPLNHSTVTLTPNPVFIFYFYLVSPVCVVLILMGVGCGAIPWSVVNLLANGSCSFLVSMSSPTMGTWPDLQ